MLIPETQLTTAAWNTSASTSGGYLNSSIHKTTLPTIANNLKKVLGTHLINRNVLLSSSINSNGYANNYKWTTAYATLMSIGQLTGTFEKNKNKYDDGEANYKLPLFDHMDYKTGYDFWSRGISDSSGAWCVYHGRVTDLGAHSAYGIRPLIYIR